MSFCGSCKFFYKEASECRRNPPIPVLYPTDNQHPIMYDVNTSFPAVTPTLWCGEYKKDYR